METQITGVGEAFAGVYLYCLLAIVVGFGAYYYWMKRREEKKKSP